nr:MAG TPA: hypothetical protein [Caudoviricetes sp.]
MRGCVSGFIERKKHSFLSLNKEMNTLINIYINELILLRLWQKQD